MHQFASGPLGSVSLIGTEPPLSPETVGRAPGSPAFLDGPVELKPIPTLPRSLTVPERPAPDPEARRLVVRLLGGEELELDRFDGRDDAMKAAAEVVAQLAGAEASGNWPEIDGRFVRPGSVASVDVLPLD